MTVKALVAGLVFMCWGLWRWMRAANDDHW